MSENEANTVVDTLKSLSDDHMRLQARVEELGKENNALKARNERLEKALSERFEDHCYHRHTIVETCSCEEWKEAKAVLEEGKK